MTEPAIALAAFTVAMTAGALVVIGVLLAARSVMTRVGDRRG